MQMTDSPKSLLRLNPLSHSSSSSSRTLQALMLMPQKRLLIPWLMVMKQTSCNQVCFWSWRASHLHLHGGLLISDKATFASLLPTRSCWN